jgi:hypothetical protein
LKKALHAARRRPWKRLPFVRRVLSEASIQKTFGRHPLGLSRLRHFSGPVWLR